MGSILEWISPGYGVRKALRRYKRSLEECEEIERQLVEKISRSPEPSPTLERLLQMAQMQRVVSEKEFENLINTWRTFGMADAVKIAEEEFGASRLDETPGDLRGGAEEREAPDGNNEFQHTNRRTRRAALAHIFFWPLFLLAVPCCIALMMSLCDATCMWLFPASYADVQPVAAILGLVLGVVVPVKVGAAVLPCIAGTRRRQERPPRRLHGVTRFALLGFLAFIATAVLLKPHLDHRLARARRTPDLRDGRQISTPSVSHPGTASDKDALQPDRVAPVEKPPERPHTTPHVNSSQSTRKEEMIWFEVFLQRLFGSNVQAARDWVSNVYSNELNRRGGSDVEPDMFKSLFLARATSLAEQRLTAIQADPRLRASPGDPAQRQKLVRFLLLRFLRSLLHELDERVAAAEPTSSSPDGISD